jgi:hypothetical protein
LAARRRGIAGEGGLIVGTSGIGEAQLAHPLTQPVGEGHDDVLERRERVSEKPSSQEQGWQSRDEVSSVVCMQIPLVGLAAWHGVHGAHGQPLMLSDMI